MPPRPLKWAWGHAVLAGILYAQAFPPLGWRWAVVPAIVWLLLTLRHRTPRTAAGLGFVFGMATYATTLSWLWLVFGAFSLALFAILALFTAAFGWVCAVISDHTSHPRTRGWLIAASWLTYEYIRSEYFWLEFPWATPGLAIGPNPLTPWIGVYGVSFAVVVGAAFLMDKATRVSGAGLFVMLGLGAWNWHDQAPPEPKSPVKIMLVQDESSQFDRYLAASAQAEKGTQLIVWPELSSSIDLRQHPTAWDQLRKMAILKDSVFVLGMYAKTADGTGSHNTALTMDQNGTLGTHAKRHLVHFFNEGVAGTGSYPVETPLGRIGTSICFDNDFEDVPRHMTQAGAEFFAVPSMDPAVWGQKQHEQHSELVRMRAAENARWFAVASSSGVTQIVSPKGQVTARLPTLTEGTLQGVVGREQQLTFYTRWGWMFPRIVILVAGIWMIWSSPSRPRS
jgi:apolipoprotein N-acyltransferase